MATIGGRLVSEQLEIDYYAHDWKTTWITKDGDYIHYEDMTDRHLLNTHRLVRNKCIDFTNRCISKNEEMELPRHLQDIIYGLETELSKRGLLE